MTKAQFDLFADHAGLAPAEPATYKPDPDRVRGKLGAVLDELRRSETMPWDRKKRAYHQVLFPQMTNALPVDEADRYRRAFDAEIARLGGF